MIIEKGDYVSSIWVCDSDNAIWAVWLLDKASSNKWELYLTWDDKDSNGMAICQTLIHRIILNSATIESDTQVKVDSMVREIEQQRNAARLSKIEIHSTDPDTIIGEIYEYALHNDLLNFRIIVYDGKI